MSGDSPGTGFSELFFRNGDRLNLYARDYPASGIASGKAPVICLHGLTRNSKDFEELAPRIAALGRRVVVMDVRGRGRSEYDSMPARYVPPTYAGDGAAWMEDLKIPRAVFVGTSMGGIITMILSALAPGRVAGAVLNDIGPRLEQAALDRIALYVGKPLPPAADWVEAAQRCKAVNGLAFPDESDAFWMTFARRTYVERDGGVALDYDPAIAAPFAHTYSDQAKKTPAPDLTPFFDALAKKPLLTIRGEISDLFSADGLAYMQSRAPQMRTAIVPNVGHAPYMTEPAAWQAIRAFLQDAP
ncbi:MAG: alpha/beta hydrolase [Caulobacterales bacterium]